VVRRFDAGPLRCVPPNVSRDTTLNTNRPSLRLFLLPLASQLALYPRRGVHAQHVLKLRPHDGPLQPCIPPGGFRWWRRIATTNSNRTTKNKDSDDHAWSDSTYSPGPPQGSGRGRRWGIDRWRRNNDRDPTAETAGPINRSMMLCCRLLVLSQRSMPSMGLRTRTSLLEK